MAEHRPAKTEPFRFGVFEIDPSARELRKHDVRVRVQYRRQYRLSAVVNVLGSGIGIGSMIAMHGMQGAPAVSPDGNQVAFSEYEGGKPSGIYKGIEPGRATISAPLL